jgi:hypothetical protein
VTREELIAAPMRTWDQATIEDALGRMRRGCCRRRFGWWICGPGRCIRRRDAALAEDQAECVGCNRRDRGHHRWYRRRSASMLGCSVCQHVGQRHARASQDDRAGYQHGTVQNFFDTAGCQNDERESQNDTPRCFVDIRGSQRGTCESQNGTLRCFVGIRGCQRGTRGSQNDTLRCFVGIRGSQRGTRGSQNDTRRCFVGIAGWHLVSAGITIRRAGETCASGATLPALRLLCTRRSVEGRSLIRDDHFRVNITIRNFFCRALDNRAKRTEYACNAEADA